MSELNQFLRDYSRIRAAEGHGFNSPADLLRLPDVARNHPHAAISRIRRRSLLDALADKVLPLLGSHLRILDLGAGTGWLSYRLGALGHETFAIDINSDSTDGLGAAKHFSCPRLLADFDRLPLRNGAADVAIFNGSFHYSTDPRGTLTEAFRVAEAVIILDSPIYGDRTSGERMVAERQEEYQRRYGTRSDAITCIQFLTWDRIATLGRELELSWRIVSPWYGIKWALRPWRARLAGTREPAQFAILLAVRRSKQHESRLGG